MFKLVFFALLALTASTVSGSACYPLCRFRFCDGKNAFLVGVQADVAFTGRICSKFGVKVGRVDRTGEAYLFKKKPLAFIRISQYKPDGLEQNFSPSFFKSYNVDGGSGIGHEVPQTNQADFLNGKCFFVPIKAYQVLNDKGNVVDNVHPTNPFRDCVAFKTFT